MGLQTASPKITVELEDTIMPKKLTILKPIGTEINCGMTAAPGVVAREAKSGALTTKVAMLEIQDIRDATIVQASFEPWIVDG